LKDSWIVNLLILHDVFDIKIL